MFFSKSFFRIFLFIIVLVDLFNYYMIRDIIWSIAWCDRGGKYNAMKKIKQNETVFSKIKMGYLLKYTNIHKREFIFWTKIKLLFEIFELIFLVSYIVCMFYKDSLFCDIVKIIVIVQAFICFFILVFQSDINRQTKYDRLRRNNRH